MDPPAPDPRCAVLMRAASVRLCAAPAPARAAGPRTALRRPRFVRRFATPRTRPISSVARHSRRAAQAQETHIAATLSSPLALDPIPLAPITIPRDRLYHVGHSFSERLDFLGLGFDARRLVHALAHATCRRTDRWHGAECPQPPGGYRARLLDLRSAVGLGASRSNRSVHAALRTLPLSGLFDFVGTIPEAPHWLAWRLDDKVHAELLDGGRYGHFDVAAVGACRNAFDLLLHERVGIARKMCQPKFALDVSLSAHFADCERSWAALGPRVLAGLGRLARAWGMGLAVIAMETGTRMGVDAVEVRLVHATSEWHNGSPHKLDPHARVVTLIAPDGRRRRLRVNTKDGIASAALGAFLLRRGVVREG